MPELAGDIGGVVELDGALGAVLAGVDHVEGGGGSDGDVGNPVPGVGIDVRRHCCDGWSCKLEGDGEEWRWSIRVHRHAIYKLGVRSR